MPRPALGCSLQLFLMEENLEPHASDSKEGLPERTAGASDRMPCGYRPGEGRVVPTAKFITLKKQANGTDRKSVV